MSERESAPFPEFDDQAVAEALGTESAIVHDVAYGEGRQYPLGRGEARLEVFVRTGVTRLTAPAVRVELFGGATPQVSGSGLVFPHPWRGRDASLTVVPRGGIVLSLVVGDERELAAVATPEAPDTAPPAPTPSPVPTEQTPPEPAQDRTDTPRGVSVSPPAPSPGPTEAPPTSRQAAAGETEQQRISLTGRLGRDPSFRTTKTGALVGRFPLAVHREDGHTDWHAVLAFGARAEQLQRRVAAGELIQGREVDVVGYRHENERPGKDGQPRRVQEVYAVAVKKR